MDDDRRTRLTSVKETEVLGCSTKSVYRLLSAERLTPLRALVAGTAEG
jgi:hypothetical protein